MTVDHVKTAHSGRSIHNEQADLKTLFNGGSDEGIIRTRDLKRYSANHVGSMSEVELRDHLRELPAKKNMKRSDMIIRGDPDRHRQSRGPEWCKGA